MFTGIVEELGTVSSLEPPRLSVDCGIVASDAQLGGSICVSGVCLTVVEHSEHHLVFDLSDETLGRTSLSRLSEGDPVNLERALTLSSRLGGHLVQGHVDGVGRVVAVEPSGDAGAWLTVQAPESLRRFIVEKGSVCLDGISLTVAELEADTFSVALIPHTLKVTTLGSVRAGDPVNMEVDVVAKYVAALVDGGTR